MKPGLTALVLAAAFLAAGRVSAEDMAGNTQFLVGQTFLGDEWAPLDKPASFAFEVDFAPASSPVRVALGFNMSGDTETVSSPLLGQTGEVGVGFLEFSAGFLWHPVKKAVARPYLGAGVVRTFAGIGSGSDWWDNTDNDQSFGLYGNAGIFFKVGDTFNIGIDGRIVRGTDFRLVGQDVDLDYEQVSLLLGFSWGSGPASPQNGSTPTNDPDDNR